MSVTSFIQDLGIISNNRVSLDKDPNLLQGKKFLGYERMYVREVEPQLKNLESTGLPGIKSVIDTENNNTILQRLENNREELAYATVLGKKEDSKLLAMSNTLQYFIYIIVTIIIIGITLNILICGDIGNKLGVIIALLIYIVYFR
tara:strand:+ start:1485 stop:1922 length:438 start_codon:yes stop_codon:yes gene_type:complete